MKHSSLGAGILLPLLLIFLGGCAQLFEFNLFQSLDPVEVPTAQELSAMPEGEALDLLEEELDSASFVDKLVEEEASFAAADGILAACMTGSADPENRKRAAVLYADLHLAASEAADAVNNASALLSQDPGSLDFASADDVGDFLQELLPQIFPPEALSSREGFDALLDGFQQAWDGYSAFGGELGADPAVPESVNLGDVAQKAVFSCLLAESLEDGSLYGTEEEARDAFWAAVSGQEPPAPNGTGVFADPFEPGTPLQNILDAAGFTL